MFLTFCMGPEATKWGLCDIKRVTYNLELLNHVLNEKS